MNPRFNVPSKGKDKTVNYEGAEAYKLDPKMELYTAVCCASLQPQFYQPEVKDQLARLRKLIEQVPHEFTAKLAVYAREKMYLRSIPLVLAVELAKIHKGDDLVARLTERVIQRADELTEILAYYQQANEREGTKKLGRLSNQLKKGIAAAFHKFDEYQFGKYARPAEIKLRDALFLSHPKPLNTVDEQLFKKIADDTLETPYTWETRLNEAGTKGEPKKTIWEELIDSKKVGFMATLRNTRNILLAEVSTQHIEKVAEYLSDPEAVQKSKQFPFRFLSAYRELKPVASPYVSYILEALEKAIQVSAENVAGYDLDTTVLIACDVSGSMETTISERSKIQRFDIGLVLGMLLQHKCKSVITGMFGETWKVIQLPRTSILSNADELHQREGEVGYSTNGYKVLEWLIDSGKKVDKIMIFTDCQMWDSETRRISFIPESHPSRMPELWNKYKQIQPEAKLYIFDLAGYGTSPLDIRSSDVCLIAGWSDKVFDVLAAIERGEKTLSEVEKVVI